ncbi:hypothetical protein [Agrococcus citreus]|uniref:Lipoprotein n=1 Tax=Agrococcus citreus TaxID=84643 RepID=A0ABP4JKM5_9MICO
MITHAPTGRLRAATAALLLSALLVGCAGAAGAPSEAPSADPAPSASPSPSPSPSGTPQADAGVIDTTSWQEFATDDGSIAFRYPADWALEAESERFAPDEGRDDVDDPFVRWMDSATLTAPNGQQLLQMTDFIDIGGTCGDVSEPVEVLATETGAGTALADASATSIATVALGTVDDRWRVGVGITGDEWLDATETCAISFVLGSSDGGVSIGTHFELAAGGEDALWTVDTLDDARAYMETAEYATILEILRSVEVA